MSYDMENLLKQLKNVKRPAQNKAATKQKLLMRIQSNQRKHKIQYRGVLLLATVLVLFLGSLLWSEGESSRHQQTSSRVEDSKAIQAIYTSENFYLQYFMARDSIFYPGNRKITAANEDMYMFVSWLLDNIQPIEQEKTPRLSHSEADIVIRFDDGQLRKFKLGELYDTYERALVDWDTKQYYTVPTLTEIQRAQLQKLQSNQSSFLPIFFIPLLLASSIVEKKIRKKYNEPSRIKLYNNWIGNSVFILIGILIMSPTFISLFLHIQIHIIVPLLIYTAYVLGDWLWFKKRGRSEAQWALMYWNYIYWVIICFVFYFFA